MKEKIKATRIHDRTERAIVLLLKERGKCRMGEILMTLKLGYQRGYQYLTSLRTKNWISTENGPFYSLSVDVE